jgi:predicted nuclease of predicted toxin-antitoxin system
MKLLFDQNLSHRLAASLAADYPGSAHVGHAGLADGDDQSVWNYARANGFCIVSKDSDFQQRALLYGHPPKVIWVRIGNCPTAAAEASLRARRADVLAFDADPAAAILILR